jgi:hypothetical protein
MEDDEEQDEEELTGEKKDGIIRVRVGQCSFRRGLCEGVFSRKEP